MSSFYRDPRLSDNARYILYIHVPTDNQMREVYQQRINDHNDSLVSNSHPDSGFDLLVEEDQMMELQKANKVDFKVKCEMLERVDNHCWVPCAFYLYPRSSISKTKFRLANNVGVIDSGYRGNLMGMFDVIYATENVLCEKNTRLLQICTATLEPFKIVMIHNDAGLSSTTRNEGGFGSTGGVANDS